VFKGCVKRGQEYLEIELTLGTQAHTSIHGCNALSVKLQKYELWSREITEKLGSKRLGAEKLWQIKLAQFCIGTWDAMRTPEEP
jgi:hypothetical protein